MTTNNNKHIIIFSCYFFSLGKVSVVFNTSSSYSNTNYPIRCFPRKQILISKYSSILHALLHLQSH